MRMGKPPRPAQYWFEPVIAELDFANRLAAGISNAHRGGNDAAFVERRIPGGAQALSGGENAAQRRADIFAEDVGDAEVLFAVVQGHANGLDHRCHQLAL